MPLYDAIVWISTASTEDDQRRILHHCLFSPAHRFTHVVYIMREANAGLFKNHNIKTGPKTTGQWKKQSLQCLLSDSNVRKERMNFTTSVRTWFFVHRLFDMYRVVMCFWPKSQQCPSMRNVCYQTYTTVHIQTNHSRGCLLLSLQSATPMQTERSDERAKNRR